MVQYKLVVLLAAFCGVYGEGYDYHDLINSGICPTRRNVLLTTFLSPQKEIITLSNPQRGIIYEQTWNSSTFKRYSECKFTLQAPPSGIYLIFRKLDLRREENGACIDYVSVKQNNNKRTLCYTPSDVPRSFGYDGPMKITIRLDHTVPLKNVEDVLRIKMVVTPKSECVPGSNMLKCQRYDHLSCIDQSFRRDGTINCPSCEDEGGCSQELEEVFVADNQSIALTAVVSLIVTMTVCGFCIWVIYKNRRYISSCGSSSSGNGRGGTNNATGGRRTRAHGRRTQSPGVLSVELPSSSNDLRPSAPKLDEKDLPPSYDALFPVAAVASTASGPTTVSTATSPTIPLTEMGRELESTK